MTNLLMEIEKLFKRRLFGENPSSNRSRKAAGIAFVGLLFQSIIVRSKTAVRNEERLSRRPPPKRETTLECIIYWQMGFNGRLFFQFSFSFFRWQPQ